MAERTCACGHTKGHPQVQQEPQFSLWGWILLSMFGVTPTPQCIIFRCIRCKQSLGSTRDPALLHKKKMPDFPVDATTGHTPPNATGEASNAPPSS